MSKVANRNIHLLPIKKTKELNLLQIIKLNKVPKHQEEFLRSMMRIFDAWATIFSLFFIFFFLYTFNFLPEFPKEETKTTQTEQIAPEDDPNRIENGIHVRTGLIVDKDYELVVNNCGACHSHKLVTQNHATAEGWLKSIRWMQETQKLWDLGKDEAKIIAYLAKNYGITEKGRRENLKDIEWYELK